MNSLRAEDEVAADMSPWLERGVTTDSRRQLQISSKEREKSLSLYIHFPCSTEMLFAM